MSCQASAPECVRNNPSLGFAAFERIEVWAPALLILGLSVQGLITATGNPFQAAFDTMLSFASVATDTIQTRRYDSEQMAFFLVPFVLVLVLGLTYYRSSAFVAVVGIVVAAVSLVPLAEWMFDFEASQKLSSFAGGAFVGVLVSLVIWVLNFFRISPENVVGDMMSTALAVYFLFVMLALIGRTKRSMRAKRRWARKKKDDDDDDDEPKQKRRWARKKQDDDDDDEPKQKK